MAQQQLAFHMQKRRVGPLPHTISAMNSKWVKDPNVRAKAVNRGNMGCSLCVLGHPGVLGVTQRHKQSEEKRVCWASSETSRK